MRRKSGRSGRISPEKTESESSKKTRRQSSRRRKRSSSHSSVDSNDGKSKVIEPVQDGSENTPLEDDKISSISKNNEEIQDTPSERSERKPSGSGSPLIKKMNEDSEEQEEGTEEREEKKNKGKSKGKSKTNIEQSSNIIEPEIEHENVQGTPQSPSNDNADNENVQNVNDTTKLVVEKQDEKANHEMGNEGITNKLEVTKSETAFESEYAHENTVGDNQKEDENIKSQETEDKYKEDNLERSRVSSRASSRRRSSSDKGDRSSSKRSSSKMSNQEERSLTPEIKEGEASVPKKSEGTNEDSNFRRKSSEQSSQEKDEGGENTLLKKKITLRRSPPGTKETEKSEKKSLQKERTSTEESGKETEEQEDKPRKKITLKRTNTDERTSNEDKGDEKPQDESSRRTSTSDAYGEKKRRLSSLCDDKGQEGEERPKKNLKKIKLLRTLSRGNDDGHEERTKLLSTERRQRWNRSDWLDKLSFYKIDVDSIKIVCPSLAFLGEDEVHLETAPRERRKSESDLKRKISMDKSDESDRPDYDKQISEDSSGEQKIELNPNIIAMNRKISIVDDTASKLRPPPSPAKHPTSDVLYITNLVRPFTVKQLKELLERTGKIKEDGFWTDRIKSKCYVHYESVEEAEATRNALHGVHWPIGNGKQLVIDYATVEDLEKAKNPAPAPKPITDKVPEKENREPVKVDEKYKEREKEKEREREREERKRRDGPVREWDLGKEDPHRGQSRSRSRSRERVRKHSRRSYTPEDYIHRKQRKVEDAVPQKLMDDLFLKTKATPSIYWQPLSPEEIATKQKQRLVRMEEHKRRIEETRVRLRESRRGSFRRR